MRQVKQIGLLSEIVRRIFTGYVYGRCDSWGYGDGEGDSAVFYDEDTD